jgi:hypothetical protein
MILQEERQRTKGGGGGCAGEKEQTIDLPGTPVLEMPISGIREAELLSETVEDVKVKIKEVSAAIRDLPY